MRRHCQTVRPRTVVRAIDRPGHCICVVLFVCFFVVAGVQLCDADQGEDDTPDDGGWLRSQWRESRALASRCVDAVAATRHQSVETPVGSSSCRSVIKCARSRARSAQGPYKRTMKPYSFYVITVVFTNQLLSFFCLRISEKLNFFFLFQYRSPLPLCVFLSCKLFLFFAISYGKDVSPFHVESGGRQNKKQKRNQ